MSDAQPIIVTEDKEEALAILAEVPEDQKPPQGVLVLTVEEATARLAEIKATNEANLAEVTQHPDPRFGVSIQEGSLALAKIEEFIDFFLPQGSPGRLAFDIQFESGTHAKLIEGARQFQQQLIWGVNNAQVVEASSKLHVVE